jgi:hypothetical protein
MKKAQSNSIANMAQTLAVPSKAGKPPRTKKGINAKTILGDSLILSHTIGFIDGAVMAENGRIAMTDHAKALHLGGVKLLKSSTAEGKKDKTTQLVRKAFFDGFESKVNPTTKKPYAKGYIDTQYQVFFNAVNTGKPIADLNADRAKAKANGKPAKANDDDAKMISALKNVWVLSSVATSAIDFIQDKLDDGFSMVQAIEDFLESEGVEITKESE